MPDVDLTTLHSKAAIAALHARFAERRVLVAADFVKFCERGDIGAQIGVRSGLLNGSAIEDLHRLGLVVPVLVSPKGTNDRRVQGYSEYEPWSTHGTRSAKEGWTEIFYHPFQFVQVLMFADALSFRGSPGWLESIANGDAASHDVIRKRAQTKLESVAEPHEWHRNACFYEVLPDLILADALVGGRVRGRVRVSEELTKRWRWAAGDVMTRKLQSFDRWRKHQSKERVTARIAPRMAALKEFAADTWRWAETLDPLREWQDLALHVLWDEREKLRGQAYTAHLLREMSLLAAHLVAYVEGGDPWRFADPDDFEWKEKRLGGPLNAADAAQKEFICNRFGLNPSPTVFWFVEGQSEETLISEVSTARGAFLDRLGIRVQPIRGVGELDNLPKAIETARLTGARVFVLVDRGDQGAVRLVEELRGRSALREEETQFSEPNLEDANFSAAEVGAVTERMRLEFEGGRIPREEWNPGKPRVIRELVRGVLLPEIQARQFSRARPIVDRMDEVIDAAHAKRGTRPKYHEKLLATARRAAPPSGGQVREP